MRCLNRNKQKFYYALYADKQPILDEFGNDTGETKLTYHTPVCLYGNISVGKGEAQTEVFGVDTQYDRIIVLDDVHSPINESALIFVGIEPKLTGNEYNNNYVVKAVARSLNTVSVAISEVGTNET